MTVDGSRRGAAAQVVEARGGSAVGTPACRSGDRPRPAAELRVRPAPVDVGALPRPAVPPNGTEPRISPIGAAGPGVSVPPNAAGPAISPAGAAGPGVSVPPNGTEPRIPPIGAAGPGALPRLARQKSAPAIPPAGADGSGVLPRPARQKSAAVISPAGTAGSGVLPRPARQKSAAVISPAGAAGPGVTERRAPGRLDLGTVMWSSGNSVPAPGEPECLSLRMDQ